MSLSGPLYLNGGGVEGFLPSERESRFEAGFYFRGDPARVQKRVEEYIRSREPMDTMPLSLVQDWTALAWKTPHASWESMRRFSAKLTEEVIEFDHALQAWEESLSPPARAEALAELGDTLFSANALAENAGCSIAVAIPRRMSGFMHHAQEFTVHEPHYIMGGCRRT